MKKLISIIIPVFNEEKGIKILFFELDQVLREMPQFEWEIIFVNDGSTDQTFLELLKLAEADQRVKVLEFSRNFGKEIALSAGCHQAQGQAAITMDADLQHPPALIKKLIAKWQEGFEVVYTVRKENKGVSFFKKLTSQFYWWLIRQVSSFNFEPYSTDFRLIDRKVLEVFRQFPEKGRIFRGIIDWIGYKRAKIEFVADKRRIGTATYSYKNLLNLAIDSVTSFSFLPLKLAGYFGLFITSLSTILLVIMLIFRWFIDPKVFTSLAFVVVSDTILIGLVLSSLGLIALYIARIYDEVIGRPLYVIREKINCDKEIRK